MKTKHLLKKLMLPVICLAVSSNVFADDPVTTFPWMEDFENEASLLLWSTEYETGTLDWVWGTGSGSVDSYVDTAYSGTKNMNIFYEDTYPAVTKFVTPALDLSGVSSPALSFWYVQPDYGGDQDELRVYYKTSATGTWTLLAGYTNDITTWTNVRLPLLNASSDYYIAFEATAQYGFGIGLDDVQVSDLTLTDATVTAISSPVSGIGLTDTETVTATIRSNSSADISGFTLALEVNGTEIATETYSAMLAPLATADYTFAATADLSAAGDYEIKVTVDLTGDEDATNDAFAKTVTNMICGTVTSFPWMEDFEGTSLLSSCWQTFDVDNTGFTWSLESTGGVQGQVAASPEKYSASLSWLVSPKLSVPANINPFLLFKCADITAFDTDSRFVYISTGSDKPADGEFVQLWEQSTSSFEQFADVKLDLSAYKGQDIYIGFAYKWEGQWIIDDVQVFDFLLTDAAVTAIGSPVSGASLSSTETVTATISNNGATDISGFTLALEVNGTEIATETYSAMLAPLTTADYTFAATVDLSAAGDYEIKVTVDLTGDEDATNDAFAKTVTNAICSTITSFPWMEDFENEAPLLCWNTEYETGTLDWAWGTGSGSDISNVDTAYSGTKNMNIFYEESDSAVTKFVTPALDLSSVSSPTLSFWYVQPDWSGDQDELRVYYRTSATGTWTLLTEYTSDVAAWTNVRLSLPEASSDYYIAFEGTAKYGYGIGLDDVQVSGFTLTDAAVTAIGSPVSGIGLTDTETVTATISNNGATDISGFTLALEVNGTEIATETYSATLTPLATADYTFAATVDLFVAGDYEIKVTVDLTGDEDATNDAFAKTVTNAICGTITSFPWTEDFEDEATLSCWTRIDKDGDGYNWERREYASAGYSHSGVACAISYSHINIGNISLDPDNYLITPALQISGGNYEANLSYWIANQGSSPAYQDTYEVWVSKTGTATADFTDILITETPSDTWTEKTFDLNDYLGQTIYIAFLHRNSFDRHAIKLDDVKVTVEPGTAVAGQESLGVKVYPNPVKDIVHISSPDAILKVSVQDINGKLLIESAATGGTLDLSQLPQGMYILKVTTDSGRIIRKITKQ